MYALALYVKFENKPYIVHQSIFRIRGTVELLKKSHDSGVYYQFRGFTSITMDFYNAGKVKLDKRMHLDNNCRHQLRYLR
jgi:hypothetical protein